MHVLAVGQFVLVLEAAGDVQKTFFVEPAAVSGANAGKAVPDSPGMRRAGCLRALQDVRVAPPLELKKTGNDLSS